jgi:hypothetical protein
MFVIRVFIAAIILIFSFQSPSQADDIRDFQIEGISIGDSLLDYFDKELIETEKYNKRSIMYKNNEYVQIGASYKKNYTLRVDSNTYDDLSIVLKTNDDSYKIFLIGGRIFCKDINVCKSKKNEIESELKNLFGKITKINKKDKKHTADPTGNSKTFNTYFNFNSGDYIAVSVYDWNKTFKDEGRTFPDNLKVSIISSEFENFLTNVQYK